jgi:sugar lactone lactonase YvrE
MRLKLNPSGLTKTLIIASICVTTAYAGQDSSIVLPVTPEIFIDEPFTATEGIAFNGEGRMFVSANKGVWEVRTDRTARKLFDMDSNLGLAAYGPRDILAADFGPTNAFKHDRNSDGVVWRTSPEGKKQAFATGIGDPNAIVTRKDGSFIVSDDATADIYSVSPEGEVSLFSTAVSHPNGMLISDDGLTLYVARIFHSIRFMLRQPIRAVVAGKYTGFLLALAEETNLSA